MSKDVIYEYINIQYLMDHNIISFLYLFSLFVLGISFGSFINNTSLRISDLINTNNNLNDFKLLKESNNPKWSQCPICENKLKWYHNIPIFSWLFLGGKCSFCDSKIPSIYIFSEFFFGVSFIFIFSLGLLLELNISQCSLFLIVFCLIYMNIVIYFTNKYKRSLKVINITIFIGLILEFYTIYFI